MVSGAGGAVGWFAFGRLRTRLRLLNQSPRARRRSPTRGEHPSLHALWPTHEARARGSTRPPRRARLAFLERTGQRAGVSSTAKRFFQNRMDSDGVLIGIWNVDAPRGCQAEIFVSRSSPPANQSRSSLARAHHRCSPIAALNLGGLSLCDPLFEPSPSPDEHVPEPAADKRFRCLSHPRAQHISCNQQQTDRACAYVHDSRHLQFRSAHE